MITVLTGGARSGKSAYAVELGRRHQGPVLFMATAPPLDDDMKARIDRHVSERPDWPTVEEPFDIAPTIRTATSPTLVIVDCLTLWVSNLMWRGNSDSDVESIAARLADDLRATSADVVLITNEVGLGVHPESELGRRYRDLLGRVNQIVVGVSDRALFMMSGRALVLSPIEDTP
jgi:adenosylcobinamide kinase/adenosylcobinamide-phosphate guanylyltransferase